ncbi:hypothetical protein AVEN_132615-1 [Araneus ventricosus]|uniref:Uncharacterized protein n=1 Tax=Araneus ventricosus TaxID=182803 RepID=A0A4Y2AVD6_ARAVE|nr:hypothetical protein AVEN_132615-1 [Araneus ventricosus]
MVLVASSPTTGLFFPSSWTTGKLVFFPSKFGVPSLWTCRGIDWAASILRAGLAGNFWGCFGGAPWRRPRGRPLIVVRSVVERHPAPCLRDGGKACLPTAAQTAADGLAKEPTPHARQRAPVSPSDTWFFYPCLAKNGCEKLLKKHPRMLDCLHRPGMR